MGLFSRFRSRKKEEPAASTAPQKEAAKPVPPKDEEISFKDEMMLVMHCPECGKALEGNSKECTHCGARLG